MTAVLTVLNLLSAAACLGTGTVKALALRHQRDWTLGLTASMVTCGGTIYLIATPAVYQITGSLLGSPNIGGLIIPALTLVCMGHAHALSQLWQPDRREPAALRRTATRWVPLYAGAIIAMSVLYALADLGPAAPLRFASVYAHAPEVRALHVIYWIALLATIAVIVREFLTLSLPGRPDLRANLRKVIGWFALALVADVLHVALAAVALFGSITGPHRLEGLEQIAWLGPTAGCVCANIALASLVLRSRQAERRDLRTLKALHDLVVRPGADHDPSGPKVVLEPRWSWWPGFDTGADLNSLMAEIHDGAGRLSPWWHRLPSMAVQKLAAETAPAHDIAETSTPVSGGQLSEGSSTLGTSWDLPAAQAAAVLLFAAQARADSAPPLPAALRLPRLPGSDVPESADRQHLVSVAKHLNVPVVLEAVDLARASHDAATA
ncbi:hypothetical protein GCM10010103_66260 [Streptomyces paradoxus]|uniref:Uncharacterized protein n=1 Tax=Streptomyces paradoxus TaxID=66375 RepID=A0A7W9TIH3_9ACTN|nr:hypothetical protein [Streptomyces paradoxus]MBB6080966.1 hypothetical protein [Streptomyces paradoxus]